MPGPNGPPTVRPVGDLNMAMSDFLEGLGRRTVDFFITVGGIFRLVGRIIRVFPRIWFYRRQFQEQLYVFSIQTLPVASIIAVFVGLAALVQGRYQTSAFIPRIYTVNVIFKTTIMELCPVVLALILAGKLGASLAAEIGSMKISDQVDALQTLSLDPVGFLVLPRVLAGVLMVPLLTTFANVIAVFSNYFASCVLSDWISTQEFFQALRLDFQLSEIILGNLVKPAVYGFLISLLGCYFGINAGGGARGVGRASTNALVVSAILIVFFDYYIGTIWL